MISVRCGSTFVSFSVSHHVCTVIMTVFNISRVREIEGYDFELAHEALPNNTILQKSQLLTEFNSFL